MTTLATETATNPLAVDTEAPPAPPQAQTNIACKTKRDERETASNSNCFHILQYAEAVYRMFQF